MCPLPFVLTISFILTLLLLIIIIIIIFIIIILILVILIRFDKVYLSLSFLVPLHSEGGLFSADSNKANMGKEL